MASTHEVEDGNVYRAMDEAHWSGWRANIGPAKRQLACECEQPDPHPYGHCRTCGLRLDLKENS
jgi:hypothetical protein